MYFMYIDESGDTIPISQGGKKFLVLSGCIIDANNLPAIERELRILKQSFFHNADIEIKSNFLRYANPDIAESSPLKLHSRIRYDELEANVTAFLKQIPVHLISIIIEKETYWTKYPAQNPYDIAYVYLLERFQHFLAKSASLGICIIDPREGQVEKHFLGNELSRLHNKMRWEDGKIWKKCPNVIEKLLFSQSDSTVGIQISDLYCYPIYHVFEYNKSKNDYWRFKEITLTKLIKDSNGNIDGWGLKFFPTNTKKDLNFLARSIFDGRD